MVMTVEVFRQTIPVVRQPTVTQGQAADNLFRIVFRSRVGGRRIAPFSDCRLAQAALQACAGII
jgi:hypothetical protein